MRFRISIVQFIITLYRHVYLSVTSVDFYQHLYLRYTGYGIRYLATASIWAAVFYSMFTLVRIVEIRDYFTANKLSKTTAVIEYIIQQLPELYYDGKVISTTVETPMYLHNKDGRTIVALDPQNKLSHIEKTKVPIILTSSNIVVSFITAYDQKRFSIPIEYSAIISQKGYPQTLDSTAIKRSLAKIFVNLPTFFIYIIMPLIALKCFIGAFFDCSITIIAIYILTNILGPRTNMQICIRLVLFSTGIVVLIQPLAMLLLPEHLISIFLRGLQMWTSFLFFMAILKIRVHDRR